MVAAVVADVVTTVVVAGVEAAVMAVLEEVQRPQSPDQHWLEVAAASLGPLERRAGRD